MSADDPTVLGYRIDGSAVVRGVHPPRLGLDAQKRIFAARRHGAYLLLFWLLVRYRRRVMAMAAERHAAGYSEYGDQMYGWPAATRLRNTLEELADAVVYPTSGPLQ